MPVSDAVIKKLEDLKANIEAFLKLHKNPYDSTQHDELAAKLERLNAILCDVNHGDNQPVGDDGHANGDMGDDTTTDGGDMGDDTTTDGGDMGDDTTTDGGMGGDGSLEAQRDSLEQARGGAREALATVADLNAAQITIEDTEKAKVEAYIIKADEFLQAYNSAAEAEKTTFDQANSGYVTEIQQSRDWNVNSFLSKTGGTTSLSILKGAVEQARNGAKEALATVADLNASPVTIDDAEKAKVEAYVAKADEFLQAYASAAEAEKTTFDQANNGYAAEIQQSHDWNANDFLPRANKEVSDTGGSSGEVDGYNNSTGKLLFEDKAVAKHGQEFITVLKEVCSKLGLEPDFLMATIDAECGFNHKAVNPMSGATGLIQFMPDTAESLGTTTNAIGNMSAIAQLDYVYKYFDGFGSLVSEISEPAESYLIVFYPYAVGKPDSYVLGSQVNPARVALIAQQNAIYDLNNDGQITKGEIMQYMRENKYKEAYANLQEGPDDDGGGTNSGDDSGSTDDTATGGLTGSVGQGGENKEADVRHIQELLNAVGYSLTVDGEIGRNTISAIEGVQLRIGNNSPDGLVEPGRNTYKALSSGNVPEAPKPSGNSFSHPGAGGVQLSYGANAIKLNAAAEHLLKSILVAAGSSGATITSSYRSYYNQARVMIQYYSASEMRNLYARGDEFYRLRQQSGEDYARFGQLLQQADQSSGRLVSLHVTGFAIDVVPFNNRNAYARKCQELVSVTGSGVSRFIELGTYGEKVDHVEFTFRVV